MSTHDSKSPGQCPGMPGSAGGYDVQCKLDVQVNIASDNQLYDIASCSTSTAGSAATVFGEEG